MCIRDRSDVAIAFTDGERDQLHMTARHAFLFPDVATILAEDVNSVDEQSDDAIAFTSGSDCDDDSVSSCEGDYVAAAKSCSAMLDLLVQGYPRA
eukprot:9743019-Karenia_brevis.AAC.1